MSLDKTGIYRPYSSMPILDSVTDDTDSSLPDYYNAKSTMPLVPGSSALQMDFMDEDIEADFMESPLYDRKTYSLPRKQIPLGSMEDQGGGSADMFSPRSVQSLPAKQMIAPKRHKRASRHHKGYSLPVDEVMESTTVERVYRIPEQQHLVTKHSSMPDISHTSAVRPTNSHESMKDKILSLQRQYDQQADMLGDVQDKLETMLSSAKRDPSSLVAEEVESLLEQTRSLTEQLNRSMRSQAEELRAMEQPFVQSEAVLRKDQQKDYKSECTTLRSMVQRLNAELCRYMAQFRKLTPQELQDIPGLPFKGPKPSWLLNTKYLAPLFVAYDDLLNSKDQALCKAQRALGQFHDDVHEVIKENQRLHIRLEQVNDGGPVGMTQWTTLTEQAKLVLEENRLLLQQLEVQEQKEEELRKELCAESTRMQQRTQAVEEDKRDLEEQLEEVWQKMSELREKHDDAVSETKTCLSREQHVKIINDLQQGMQDERKKYSEETLELSGKLQSTEMEKKVLCQEVEKLKATNTQLDKDIKLRNENDKKLQKQADNLKQMLDREMAAKIKTEQYLLRVIKAAESIHNDRNSLLQTIQDAEKSKNIALSKLVTDDITLCKMEQKIKLLQEGVKDDVLKSTSRLGEHQEEQKQRCEEYEREIQRLRLLVKQKDELTQTVCREKKQILEDLDTLCDKAKRDNFDMKEELGRLNQRLRHHEGLEVSPTLHEPHSVLDPDCYELDRMLTTPAK